MKQLRIIIIGGGIAGLTAAFCLGRAGHQVIVLERHDKISEIGAGIQIGPNMARLLIRWGLKERLSQVAIKPEFLTFHRYDNGEQLGFTLFGDYFEQVHGVAYYQIHRADLIQLLHDLARPYMDLKLGCRVVSIDTSSACVYVEGGKFQGDLIVGADGFRSLTRQTIAPDHLKVKSIGDVAYRVVLPVELVRQDETLADLLNVPHVMCWLGPGRHVISYTVKGGTHYYIALMAPEADCIEAMESWVAEGSLSELRALYVGWDRRVEKLLELATSCHKTKVTYMEPLPSWTDSSRKVTLVGDACHPMPPYRAQAAAMAVEDCAVLGVLFSRITSVAEIPKLLSVYESLRIARTSSTLQASLVNRGVFHMHDGEDQQSRDISMRGSMEDALRHARTSEHAGNANMWADKQKNQELFDYDAEAVAEAWFRVSKAKL